MAFRQEMPSAAGSGHGRPGWRPGVPKFPASCSHPNLCMVHLNVSMACVTEGPGGKKIEKIGLPAKFFNFFQNILIAHQ